MRTRPTRFLATIAATVLLAAPAACSGDPDPIIEPSPPAASPTPTATPTAPERESAKAFIRRWQDEAFAMQLTGDTGRYRAMTKRCQGCDAFANRVDNVYRRNGSIEIVGAKVGRVEKTGTYGKAQIFEFDVVSSATVVRDSEGQVRLSLDGGRVSYQTNLERQRGEWRVIRISELV
ncbi:MAG: hypothetical protein WB471_07780 [Nocardioides sp.]